jgi:hypothetical protein
MKYCLVLYASIMSKGIKRCFNRHPKLQRKPRSSSCLQKELVRGWQGVQWLGQRSLLALHVAVIKGRKIEIQN